MNPLTQADLHAFVDDELDGPARVRVLNGLLVDQKAAHQVLVDLRDLAAFRILHEREAQPSRQLCALATALDARLVEPPVSSRQAWRRGVALAACAVAIVVAGSVPRMSDRATAHVPAYLEEALASQRAARIRQQMASQFETPGLDPRDLRTATRIRLPRLTRDWRVLDVQVFPSDFGPSVQLSIHTSDGTLSLFATHAATGAPRQPQASRVGPEEMVAWSVGGNTYVLTGSADADLLMRLASDLSDNSFA